MPQCTDSMMFSCTDAGSVLSIVLGFCLVVLAELLIRRVDGYVLDSFSGRSEQLAPFDQHAASVAATVIQWLCSNVGFSFLERALADCGFEIKRKRSPNA